MTGINNWNSDIEKMFSNTNNIILETMQIRRNGPGWAVKYYLVSKMADEFYFYDGVKIYYDDSCKYDNDLNLQILNSGNEIIKEFKNEKHFSFKPNDLTEKRDSGLCFIIELPLPKGLNIDEFNNKGNSLKISLLAKVKDQAIEDLSIKQQLAVHYDANQAYNQIYEEEMEIE